MRVFFRELLKGAFVGTCIFAVLLTVGYFSGEYDNGFDYAELWNEYQINLMYSAIIYMTNAYLFIYLLRRYDGNLYGRKSFPISMVATVTVSLLSLFFARFLHRVVLEGEPIATFWAKQRLEYYWVSLSIALVVALIFYSFFYFKYRQESKVKEQKIIAGTASAKFDALKNQLDPHFLFNSLNVLTSLIEENPHQAQKFTTSLSKVYRYVLEQKNKDLVSVDEELRFARTYIGLLNMRFEGSIVCELPESVQNPEAKIVPLSLQLLLENAVKHNIVTSSKPLIIKVFEKDSGLVVQNNLQEKQCVKKSSGVGLRNIRQRYGILTDRTIEIQKTNSTFSVRLPILSKQISVMESQEDYLEDKRYEQAKERVENIKGFYGNLLAYCIVIPFLTYLNYRTTGYPWVLFPIFGWGIGLTIHGMQAFGYNPLWGKRWEEKKMREFMEDDGF
ncbi:2TM domain-containing protein [Pricia sp. S334]|uniref:2TM domain-containing protein n=1 Tax=Pricia mediterranea TaxID=3076079 RepID=A0ABU3L2C1_9FLAO|nr:2TM domain-containing protein [Pricia sp. S334]MDT7827884.1 2TM domain-containing protein [Pricia sp. S334]